MDKGQREAKVAYRSGWTQNGDVFEPVRVKRVFCGLEKMSWDEWKALMVRALMWLGAMRSKADHPKTL